MKQFPALVLALICLASALITPSSAQDLSFQSYVEVLRSKARAEGVNEDTIARMTAGLTPNQRVLNLDRSQPGAATQSGYSQLSTYIRTHVSAYLINRGRSIHTSNPELNRQIEARFGVPARVVLAIWGHETNFGSVKGDFDLARSLATLAWEGRRRALFEGEFIALMKMADKGYSRGQLVGSWAGALGNPQFLPSVYLRLATDGDNDGRADIFTNQADTMFSIARYFQDAGWRRGVPWGIKANIPENFNWNAVSSKIRSPICGRVHDRHSQWKTVAEWRNLGVFPYVSQPNSLPDNTMVTLFQPDGAGTSAWLLTSNYRVILEYNCSNYYAMSVGLLSDEIGR